MKLPRVTHVSAQPDYRLHVRFNDGVEGTVDLTGELDAGVFRPLRDVALFRQVSVDDFGAVAWPNGVDIAPDALYGELTASRPLPSDASRHSHSRL